MLCAPSCPLLLLLLAMPAPTRAWSRPLWYQVGLDLQPWGCQPNGLDGCGVSLGCSGRWLGLGMNRIYPVAGVTLTTTAMLVISRKVLQWRRPQASKSEVSTALLGPPRPPTSAYTRGDSYPPTPPGPCPPHPSSSPAIWASCCRLPPLTPLVPATLRRLLMRLFRIQPPRAAWPLQPTADSLPLPRPFSLALLLPLTRLPSCPSALTPASRSCPQPSKVTTDPSGSWKRRTPISDRALLLGVLHMLDALLVQIEGHLQRLATRQPLQIKGIPT